jgi:formate dehydrogenase maturation protein FdhE
MAKAQEQRSEAKRQQHSENSRDKEKIDRLRQGLDEIEFQQFAQQRKQEYIRDLLNQMELSKSNKAQERVDMMKTVN